MSKENKKETKAENKKVKIKFLLSPAGLYFLPYNVGQEVEIDELQAQEIVDAKYAEYVK